MLRLEGHSPNIKSLLFLAVVIERVLSNMSLCPYTGTRLQIYEISTNNRREWTKKFISCSKMAHQRYIVRGFSCGRVTELGKTCHNLFPFVKTRNFSAWMEDYGGKASVILFFEFAAPKYGTIRNFSIFAP